MSHRLKILALQKEHQLSRLTQNLKRDKLAALCRHMSVTGNLDLINLDRLKLTTDPKKERQFSSFIMVINEFL